MNYAVDRLDRRERLLEQRDEATPSSIASTSKGGALALDLESAHSLLLSAPSDEQDRPSDIHLHSSPPVSSTSIREGHELAGRTLRDGGFCAQASFHFGMAWMCDEDNALAAGDYAQMADLCGYPEIGVLSVLYFRAGHQLLGTLQSCHATNVAIPSGNIFLQNNSVHGNCGCGMSGCGHNVPCFLPFKSHDAKGIIDALSLLQGSRVSLMDNDARFAPLLFWKNDDNHNSTNQFRILPPVVQLLLLKLLYCSPVGGPFLMLACESVPFIASKIKYLGAKYKSHWAYFVLIRALVEGWKVKLHRRNTVVPYHVPVKDILSGKGLRSKFGGIKINYDDYEIRNTTEEAISKDMIPEQDSMDFVNYLESVLHNCAQNMASFSSSTTEEDNGTPFSIANTPIHLQIKPLRCPCSPHPPLFLVGDSHTISVAWQTIHISTKQHMYRTAVPYPATGIKAWHTTTDAKPFFTRYNFFTNLARLPHGTRSIVLSAGEIDCREGIGGEKLQGYIESCEELVENTVRSYVDAVCAVAVLYDLQILLLPVAPHAYRSDKNGKAMGRAKRRDRIAQWNRYLRREIDRKRRTCPEGAVVGVFLLDYDTELREKDSSSSPVLNKHYNADYTHMNSAFLPLLEDAIVECGCDLTLL